MPWQRIARIPTPRRSNTPAAEDAPHQPTAGYGRSPVGTRDAAATGRAPAPASATTSSRREGIELARYLLLVARYRLPDYDPLLVFDEHNAEWVLQRRAAQTDLRNPRRWPVGAYSAIQQGRLRRFEAQTMQTADLTLCVSATDAAALQPLAPSRPLIVAPNGVDLAYYSTEGIPRERPRFDVIFSGTLDYRPNIDAVNLAGRGDLADPEARPGSAARSTVAPRPDRAQPTPGDHPARPASRRHRHRLGRR